MVRNLKLRKAVAAVELAVLLPFLLFVFLIVIDWSRIFYHSVIVTNSARNGAIYASDPVNQPNSPYADVTAAALADAQNLSPAPSVAMTKGSDSTGPYVEVTVSSEFRTITNFPGIPQSTMLVRKVRMQIQPKVPN